MSNSEKIDQIREAVLLIEEAQGMVEDALSNTSLQSNFESYRKYGFDTLLGNGNPYDESLFSLIENIENGEDA